MKFRDIVVQDTSYPNTEAKCYFCDTDREVSIQFVIPKTECSPAKIYHIDCLVYFIEHSVNDIENMIAHTSKFKRADTL